MQLLASLPTSTPLRTFAPFLSSLWSLWECLILAEPILVIAPDPRTCSEIIWWLRDLLRPVGGQSFSLELRKTTAKRHLQFPPAGDFRPYLHIHDHDFSLLVNSGKPQAGVVVGVTVSPPPTSFISHLYFAHCLRIHSFETRHLIGQM